MSKHANICQTHDTCKHMQICVQSVIINFINLKQRTIPDDISGDPVSRKATRTLFPLHAHSTPAYWPACVRARARPSTSLRRTHRVYVTHPAHTHRHTRPLLDEQTHLDMGSAHDTRKHLQLCTHLLIRAHTYRYALSSQYA